MRCHGTKYPLLTAFFLSLSFSLLLGLLFTRKELLQCSKNLHGVLSHKKIRFGVKQLLGDPPARQGVDFLGLFFRQNEKCLESPEMTKKLIGKFYTFVDPLPDTCAEKCLLVRAEISLPKLQKTDSSPSTISISY